MAWGTIIDHQYTGSSEAMTRIQICDNMGQEALAIPSVTVKAEIYILADSQSEAEQEAERVAEAASWELPGDTMLSCYAYETPNQSKELKSKAINYRSVV